MQTVLYLLDTMKSSPVTKISSQICTAGLKSDVLLTLMVYICTVEDSIHKSKSTMRFCEDNVTEVFSSTPELERSNDILSHE